MTPEELDALDAKVAKAMGWEPAWFCAWDNGDNWGPWGSEALVHQFAAGGWRGHGGKRGTTYTASPVYPSPTRDDAAFGRLVRELAERKWGFRRSVDGHWRLKSPTGAVYEYSVDNDAPRIALCLAVAAWADAKGETR